MTSEEVHMVLQWISSYYTPQHLCQTYSGTTLRPCTMTGIAWLVARLERLSLKGKDLAPFLHLYRPSYWVSNPPQHSQWQNHFIPQLHSFQSSSVLPDCYRATRYCFHHTGTAATVRRVPITFTMMHEAAAAGSPLLEAPIQKAWIKQPKWFGLATALLQKALQA